MSGTSLSLYNSCILFGLIQKTRLCRLLLIRDRLLPMIILISIVNWPIQLNRVVQRAQIPEPTHLVDGYGLLGIAWKWQSKQILLEWSWRIVFVKEWTDRIIWSTSRTWSYWILILVTRLKFSSFECDWSFSHGDRNRINTDEWSRLILDVFLFVCLEQNLHWLTNRWPLFSFFCNEMRCERAGCYNCKNVHSCGH